ncbi:hypothetical protein Tco_1202564 [Tanacetum coccineum]
MHSSPYRRSNVGACGLPLALFHPGKLDRVLGTLLPLSEIKRNALRNSSNPSMLLRGSLLNQFRAFPTNVELNMWHPHGLLASISIWPGRFEIFRVYIRNTHPIISFYVSMHLLYHILRRIANAPRKCVDLLTTPWRDISSSSSPRYLFLDFQCPVSASSLSEVSSEDEPYSIMRAFAELSRVLNLEGFHSWSRHFPSLLWTSRLSPSQSRTLMRGHCFPRVSKFCKLAV